MRVSWTTSLVLFISTTSVVSSSAATTTTTNNKDEQSSPVLRGNQQRHQTSLTSRQAVMKLHQYTMEQEKQQKEGSDFSQRLLAEQAKLFDASQMSVIQESLANLDSDNNDDVKSAISKLHEALNGSDDHHHDGRGVLADAAAATPVDETMLTAWVQDPLSMVDGLILALKENDTTVFASYMESAKAALKMALALLNKNDDGGAIGSTQAELGPIDPIELITFTLFLTFFPGCVIFAGLPACYIFALQLWFCEVLLEEPGFKEGFCEDYDNSDPIFDPKPGFP